MFRMHFAIRSDICCQLLRTALCHRAHFARRGANVIRKQNGPAASGGANQNHFTQNPIRMFAVHW